MREPDGTLISENRGGVRRHYHFDGNGNTVALTDDNGNVTDTFAYSAFGEVKERTGTTPTPYQYHGREGLYRDMEAGGYHVDGREYSSGESRWLSIGSLQLRATRRTANPIAKANPYIFADNSPIVFAMLAVIAAARLKFPKMATATLDCPGYGWQYGQCSFKLSFNGRIFPDGTAAPGVRICFEQAPGEWVPPAPKDVTICQSEINRSLGPEDNMTIELLDGTACKYTEPNFPRNAPWPPIGMDPKCTDILRVEDIDPGHPPMGPLKGACYVTTDSVKSISVSMTMEIGCYCTACKGFANYDSLKLEASSK